MKFTELYYEHSIIDLKTRNTQLSLDCDLYKTQLHYAKEKIRTLEINNQGLQEKILNQTKEINRLSKLSNKNWDNLKEKFIQFCEKELKKWYGYLGERKKS